MFRNKACVGCWAYALHRHPVASERCPVTENRVTRWGSSSSIRFPFSFRALQSVAGSYPGALLLLLPDYRPALILPHGY